MSLKRAAVVPACLLAFGAGALAGCGGGDDDGGGDTAAQDQSEVRVTAEHFMQAWGTDDAKTACGLMSEEFRQHQASLVNPPTCATRVTQYNEEKDKIKSPRANTFRIVRLVVAPPAGQVVLQAKNERPERSITLTKNADGKWEVVDFTF